MQLKQIIWGALAMGMILSAGCASWDGYAGVDNRWRAEDVPVWVEGKTTVAEVAKYLGPPSQIIPLHDETVFYYMREGKEGTAIMLIVWNTGTQVASYDRAIFIFDGKGVLKTYSYSNDTLPYEMSEEK